MSDSNTTSQRRSEYGGRKYITAGVGGMLIPVDTRTGAPAKNKPHTRHRAIINAITVPFGFGKDLRVLNSSVAATRCGKMLSRYNDATQTSLRDSEGGEYSRECPTCFEDNPASEAAKPLPNIGQGTKLDAQTEFDLQRILNDATH